MFSHVFGQDLHLPCPGFGVVDLEERPRERAHSKAADLDLVFAPVLPIKRAAAPVKPAALSVHLSSRGTTGTVTDFTCRDRARPIAQGNRVIACQIPASQPRANLLDFSECGRAPKNHIQVPRTRSCARWRRPVTVGMKSRQRCIGRPVLFIRGQRFSVSD